MTVCVAISSLTQNKYTVESPPVGNIDTMPFLNSCQIFKSEKENVKELWKRPLLIPENSYVYSVVICALFTIWNVLTKVGTTVIKISPHMTDTAC